MAEEDLRARLGWACVSALVSQREGWAGWRGGEGGCVGYAFRRLGWLESGCVSSVLGS